MKIKSFFTVFTFILLFEIPSFAQTAEFYKLIEETKVVADKTAYQANLEYTFDVKQTHERNGKKRLTTFESVCSKKRCVFIVVAKNGAPLPEKEIVKNRERAAAKLEKAENLPETNYNLSPNIAGASVFTSVLPDVFYRKSAYFNPNVYLKNCKINFVEKDSFENRSRVKISATDCSDNVKLGMSLIPITSASIWIDEQDRAVVKLEVYGGEKQLGNVSDADKPFMIMEAARVLPAGFWFWKSMMANTAAPGLFSKDFKFIDEFFNYRPYSVTVEKAEIDKK
jgi:hypothetical protein